MPDSKDLIEEASKRTEEHEFYNNIPEGYVKGKTKYIIITGSVISGVGKGTFSSCLGGLLRMKHGLNVLPIKLEGYLNYDSGTLNPYRHGEVFVLDDGTECDLDLGTYERMLNTNLTGDSFVTAGRIFKTIIDKERAGQYLGRDVQFIPHVTGEIKNYLRGLAMKKNADMVMVEIGGTVGDIENSYYMEAMRELSYEEGRENVCFINVVYILEPGSLGEQKSKAAQLGLRTLMGLGIQPNIVVCRSERPLKKSIKEKISIYSNVPVPRVIQLFDTRNIYKVPLKLMEMGIDDMVLDILKMGKTKDMHPDLQKWEELSKNMDSAHKKITIGIAGKYTNVHDSYLSIIKALEHTSPYYGATVDIKWMESSDINSGNVSEHMKGLDGLIIPGGFGVRGIEGKIECIRFARENNIPFLGLCLGFQLAAIEYARNVAGIEKASSSEIDGDGENPVICIIPDQEKIKELGGTMRLGGYDMDVKEGSQTHSLYGNTQARERHRHRFEMNPDYIDRIEVKGLVFSGKSKDGKLMEILEFPNNRFHIATQAHAEFTSKPLDPNPLFKGFIEACITAQK